MGLHSWIMQHKLVSGIIGFVLLFVILMKLVLPLLGVHVVVYTSGSMAPTIQQGDSLIVTETSFNSIEEGDIVMYDPLYLDTPLIHRVTSRTETALETQGDNNADQIQVCVTENEAYTSGGNCPDGSLTNVEKNVTAEQVIGKVRFVLP